MAELRAQGIHVYDLFNFEASDLGREQVELLLGYLENWREGLKPLEAKRLAAAIAVARARAPRDTFDRIASLYVAEDDWLVKEGLAGAAARLANKENIDALMALVRDEANGESRILLLRGLSRLRDPEGRALLESLCSHPVLGVEATARVTALHRRR